MCPLASADIPSTSALNSHFPHHLSAPSSWLMNPQLTAEGLTLPARHRSENWRPQWGNSRPPPCPGLGWEGCRPLLLLAPSSQKPSMDSKDEVSDTDSGIILQSGEWFRPPSPRVPEPPTPPFPESMSPGLWAPRVAGQTPGGLEGFPCWGSGQERGSCLGKYLQRSPLAPPSLRSWKILSGWGEGLRLWSLQAGGPSGDWFGRRTREKRCGWCVSACERERRRSRESSQWPWVEGGMGRGEP